MPAVASPFGLGHFVAHSDSTYEASQITLWRRAQQLNADGRRYDVILHGSGTNRHLHVEPP
jgi:hypothetical protein